MKESKHYEKSQDSYPNEKKAPMSEQDQSVVNTVSPVVQHPQEYAVAPQSAWGQQSDPESMRPHNFVRNGVEDVPPPYPNIYPPVIQFSETQVSVIQTLLTPT